MKIRELPIRLNSAQQSLKPVIPAQQTPKSDRLLAWLLLLHELKRERLIRAMLTGIQNIGKVTASLPGYYCSVLLCPLAIWPFR